MNKNVMGGLLFLASMTALGAAQAAGDIEAGQAKSAPCAACHGADGKGITPEWPNLAAQVPGYIADQLKAFQSGARVNAVMQGQVTALSDEDMADLDAYYSSLPPVQGAVPEEQAEAAEAGARLYRGGDSEMRIAACMSCHGPTGRGIPTRFPMVSGQPIEYLKSSLLAFKSGERQSEGGIMNTVSFLLSQEQIENLSVFMHGLK